MNKWEVKESSKTYDRRFVIEEEEGIGFYIYVFEGSRCVFDYLQDSFDFAVEFAEEEFGVNPDLWRPVK